MQKINNYCLREIRENDLETVIQWRNSERIRSVMYTDHLISYEEHKSWYDKLKESGSKCLVFESDMQLAGIINITRIDRVNKKCLWGFYLGVTDLPRGSGLVMGYLALEYIFEELDVRKLCGEAFAFNLASINFHKKLGFNEEGRLVNHIFKNGNYEDIIVFSLFKDNWLNSKDGLRKICFGDGEK